ncbi:hypothetical protein BK022_10395 [Methylorubrum extorquens]|uniref:BrnT family toxin n=1 Tax=Methylorubrum extorquens TaxID=408 RepID=A0A1S1P152_METEX|nr:hypothetical protein BK022_10395 [Methylorubrum extorquens]
MGFQWNLEKNAANQAKHLISFRQEAEIFRGFRLTREDTRRNYGERRLIALGEYDNEVLRLVYTLRDGDVRIISAWKASRHERKAYATARQARPV